LQLRLDVVLEHEPEAVVEPLDVVAAEGVPALGALCPLGPVEAAGDDLRLFVHVVERATSSTLEVKC
jgi:hypothetical protein